MQSVFVRMKTLKNKFLILTKCLGRHKWEDFPKQEFQDFRELSISHLRLDLILIRIFMWEMIGNYAIIAHSFGKSSFVDQGSKSWLRSARVGYFVNLWTNSVELKINKQSRSESHGNFDTTPRSYWD